MIDTNIQRSALYSYIAIFLISQIVVNFLSHKVPIIESIILIGLCAYGALLVYEFLFKKTMSVTGVIIPYGEKPGLRLFLLGVGCAALIYGYRGIYIGLSFI